MTNLTYLKITTVAIVLSASFCKFARAENEIDCPTGSSTTSTCWECGPTCTAKFDSATHTMTFSGEGGMYAYEDNTPWKGIASRITTVVVEEGITALPYSFVHTWKKDTSNITSISLPTSLTKIGNAAFARLNNGNQLNGLVIPENVTEWGSSVFYYSLGDIYCPKSQINNCNANNDGGSKKVSISAYEKKDGMYYVYDSQNNVAEIYDSYGSFSANVKKPAADRVSQKDENGNITLYDAQGNIAAIHTAAGVLTKYAYGRDGSVAAYDAKGNLKKFTKRGPFTIPEADALTKEGPVNTVTITW